MKTFLIYISLGHHDDFEQVLKFKHKHAHKI